MTRRSPGVWSPPVIHRVVGTWTIAALGGFLFLPATSSHADVLAARLSTQEWEARQEAEALRRARERQVRMEAAARQPFESSSRPATAPQAPSARPVRRSEPLRFTYIPAEQAIAMGIARPSGDRSPADAASDSGSMADDAPALFERLAAWQRSRGEPDDGEMVVLMATAPAPEEMRDDAPNDARSESGDDSSRPRVLQGILVGFRPRREAGGEEARPEVGAPRDPGAVAPESGVDEGLPLIGALFSRSEEEPVDEAPGGAGSSSAEPENLPPNLRLLREGQVYELLQESTRLYSFQEEEGQDWDVALDRGTPVKLVQLGSEWCIVELETGLDGILQRDFLESTEPIDPDEPVLALDMVSLETPPVPSRSGDTGMPSSTDAVLLPGEAPGSVPAGPPTETESAAGDP